MAPPRGRLSIGQTVALLLGGLGLLYGAVALGAGIKMLAQGISFEQAITQVTSEPLGPGLAQLVALGTVVLVGTRLAYGDRSLRDALQLRPVPASVVLLAMVAGLTLHFPLLELMTVLSHMVPAIALDEETLRRLEELTRIDSPLRAVGALTTLVVIAAGTEELVFRGLLLPALRPQLGAGGALVVTSFLFGLFHLEPFVVVYATIAGLVLGAIALRTGSVLPSIAFHGAFNAVPLLLPASVVSIEGFNAGGAHAHMPLGLVITTGLAGAIALALLYRVSEPPGGDGPEREE